MISSLLFHLISSSEPLDPHTQPSLIQKQQPYLLKMVSIKTLATLAVAASASGLAMPAPDQVAHLNVHVGRQLPPPIGPKPRVTFCRDINWQGGCYVQDSDWGVCCMFFPFPFPLILKLEEVEHKIDARVDR